MGILNNIEEGLQSMDAYTIKMRMYERMSCEFNHSITYTPPMVSFRNKIIAFINNILYEEYIYEYGKFSIRVPITVNASTESIKHFFQLTDIDIGILTKSGVCSIHTDRIYFDNTFIDDMKKYMLSNSKM